MFSMGSKTAKKKADPFRKPAFFLYEPKPYFDYFVPLKVAITTSISIPRTVAV